MRINELREEVQDLGKLYDLNLRVREELNYIFIDRCNGKTFNTVAMLGTKQMYTINTDMFYFFNLPHGLKDDLLNLFVKFVRTPLELRTEEKKYQYRLKEKYWWIIDDFDFGMIYLNLTKNEDCEKPLSLNDSADLQLDQTKFTDKEIQEVVKEHNLDLSMFDKIEVE